MSTSAVQKTQSKMVWPDLQTWQLDDAGTVVSHNELLNRVWGSGFQKDREYLHVHMGHLKSKIESGHPGARHIVAVRGVGYLFQHSG